MESNRRRSGKLLAASFLLIVVACPSGASAQDHPELIDVTAFGTRTWATGASNARLTVRAPAPNHVLYATVTKSVSMASGNGNISIVLYEPDTVRRKANLANLKQKTHAFLKSLNFATSGAAFNLSTSAIYADCGGSIKFKDRDGTPGVSAGDRMRWSVKCKAALFDTLGLTAAQRAAFTKIFKTPIVKLSGVASNVSP